MTEVTEDKPGGWKLVKLFWDRAAAVACGLTAALMLSVGWFALSDQTEPGEQIPYVMSGGIGGLFLASIGITLWISADHRDEWHKLDAIDERLKQLADPTGREVRLEPQATVPVDPVAAYALQLERK